MILFLSMESYWEIKATLESMIKKIKEADPERGVYLERHIQYDDQTATFSYSGKGSIMNALLGRIKIRD